MHRLRLLVVGASIAASFVGIAASPAAAVDCNAIAPSANAATNHANITTCLGSGTRVARLLDGTFPVSPAIVMPASSHLTKAASATGTPTVSLASGAQALIHFDNGNAQVSHLNLRGNSNFIPMPVNGVVIFNSSSNWLHDVIVEPANAPSTDGTDTGVYYSCTSCTGNRTEGAVIRNGYYGVIINTSSGRDGARLATSMIHSIACDSVTLRDGYASGRVVDNWIFNNGNLCNNGPIPGGGIYSANNAGGFLLQGNTVHDNCGMGIDLHNVVGAEVTGNVLSNPGNTGLGAWCDGQVAMGLLDVRGSIITNNNVQNVNRATNRIGNFGDPNVIFRNTFAAAYSDLPFGANTAVAAFIATSASTRDTLGATGNWVSGNTFVGACSGSCAGLGLFTSRNSGNGPNRTWSDQTTNYFLSNNVAGSNYGSRRGGNNWWAGSYVCPAVSPPPECNNDDFQHDPPVGHGYRSDVGYEYFD